MNKTTTINAEDFWNYLKTQYEFDYDEEYDILNFDILKEIDFRYLNSDDFVDKLIEDVGDLKNVLSDDFSIWETSFFGLYESSILDYFYSEELPKHIQEFHITQKTEGKYKDLYDELEYIYEYLIDNGKVNVDLSVKKLFNHIDVEVHCILETEEAADSEYTIISNNSYSSKNLKEMLVEALDNYDEKDISMIQLMKYQGYTFEDFLNWWDSQDENKFFESLEQEYLNLGYNGMLMTTINMSLREYLDALSNDEPIQFYKTLPHSFVDNDNFGYFGPLDGSGSIFGIHLEKDFSLKPSEMNMITENEMTKYSYTPNDVY